jgi:cell wall-associated NlpC family hydrolase
MGFAAEISEWARQTEGALETVFQEAALAVANEVRTPVAAGGRMPIRTGNLRRSLMASTSDMPSIKPEKTEFTDSGLEMVIAGAELGSTVFLGFQAAYAARMNYGFVGEDSLGRTYNQAGFGFVDAVAQRWPQIVTAAEAKVRTPYEAGSSDPTGSAAPSA